MAEFIVRFNTQIDLAVTIESEDEDAAADGAWKVAEDYLRTVFGDHRGVVAEATLDGIGEYAIEPTDTDEKGGTA